jgi:hypothetical protein
MTESSLVVQREEEQREGFRDPAPVWRWIARLAVLVPIFVAVIRALSSDWMPVGDDALLAVRASDVATGHHPLLGSWTSASLALGIDVNNPGPLYYDLVAPFMWTLGKLFGISAATAIAIGTINALAALGTVLVGSRVGGWRSERWMLVLVAALTWSMGSELLIDIWQPHALLLPFCLLFALTVAVAGGDARLLPVWVGVASLVVQTHVGYVYVVAALTVVVGVALVRRTVATRDDEPWGQVVRAIAATRTFAWTVVVVVVAWIQPVWEQLFGRGEGNLQRLATNAGGGDLTVGAGTSVKIVAAVTALPPWWTRFGFEDSVVSTDLTQTADGPKLFVPGLPGPAVAVLALTLLFVVLAALVVTLRRPEQRIARAAAVVSVVMLAVAVAGLAIQAVTVTGLRNHQVRWLFALSAIVHVTIAWGLVEWALARWPQALRWRHWVDAAIVSVVALMAVANLPYHAHDLGPVADRAAADTLHRTFTDLSQFDPQQPVVYDVDNIRVYEPYSSAVMMRLRELGIEFRFEDGVMVRQFGDGRRADGDESTHIRQYERSDALLYDGDGCVVSLRSAVPAEQEAAVDALMASATNDVVAASIAVDGLPDDVRRLAEAAASGDRDAAFRLVAQALLPVLVDEGRLASTPAVSAAVAANDDIVERVNSTLLVVATPPSACAR